MGHSNALGGVGTDQRLGNTMNTRERFDLVGRSLGSTVTATAVPDPTSVTLVMPCHLREVRIEVEPHATDHDRQTGIEIVGREQIAHHERHVRQPREPCPRELFHPSIASSGW